MKKFNQQGPQSRANGFENDSVNGILNIEVEGTQEWNGLICGFCGMECLSERSLRAHRRSCRNMCPQDDATHGQDNIVKSDRKPDRFGVTASQLSGASYNHVLESNHNMHEGVASADQDPGYSLRHDREVRRRGDIDEIPIRVPIILPKSQTGWKMIDETVQTQLSLKKPYLKSDSLEVKCNKVNNFVYGVFEGVMGNREAEKQRAGEVKEKKRKDEEVEIRRMKNELKKNFKRCSTDEEKAENRKTFYRLIRLHNKLRKAKQQSVDDRESFKQRQMFKKNPYQCGKDLLKPSDRSGDPEFTEEVGREYFVKCYEDLDRGRKMEAIPEMVKHEAPASSFDFKTPTTEEVVEYIKKRRNKSAGGTTRIQYVMLKKCKAIMMLYVGLIVDAWDHLMTKQRPDDLPVHWTVAIRKLIPKTDDLLDPSKFRDINLSNIDGKIFFGLLSRRANNFMVKNKFIDTKIQKGFIRGVPGVLEHTYSMTEIVRNSREHQRSLCITWLDLKNAFGSVSHDLIDFAMEWYHWPEPVRKVIHAYYRELYVRVETRPWNLDWIRIEKGIFQGDTIADILFNSPWNICLEMVEASSVAGYHHKEADVQTKQKGYVDDLTVITATACHNQQLLDLVTKFLEWSGMQAKPCKCRTFAHRGFSRDGRNLGFQPINDTMFSAYDPKLTISGAPIPFMGDEPYKMLGKNIAGKSRRVAEKDMVKEKLERDLLNVGKSKLTGVQKTWIYEHLIIPSIRWELTIYEFGLTFVESLNSLITKFLKKWLGITRSADTSILYRSKDHFGLNLPNITTVYKSTQIGREFKMKCSKDSDIQSFYTAKSQVQSLKKNWNSTKHLEQTERAVVLDEMSVGGQTSRHGVGYVVKEKLPMSRKIVLKSEEMDEDERFSHAAQLAMQGSWTKWDHVMSQDWSWQALLYSYSPSLVSFALNSIQLTLPTPDNLQRWNKRSDAECVLCKRRNCTLLHILTGCYKSLQEGRYTWRHDSILSVISKYLRSVIVYKNESVPVLVERPQTSHINFVKRGEKPSSASKVKHGLLDFAADWILYDDLGQKLVFPTYIYATSQRPDIVIVSNNTRAVILVELTSPSEENIQQRNSDKRKKYEELIEGCRANGWKAHLFCVEVGARGFVADSFFGAMRKLGLKNSEVKGMKRKVSNIALRCSYAIYIQRERHDFVKWKMDV